MANINTKVINLGKPLASEWEAEELDNAIEEVYDRLITLTNTPEKDLTEWERELVKDPAGFLNNLK